jgi:hypothetical protein
MRALSANEITALQNGTYDGVDLLVTSPSKQGILKVEFRTSG